MLSEDQIKYLFKFCEKHLVYFYEVQRELVDHLANAIEEEMKNDNRLSFDSALEKVYSRFGAMGFAPLVREKTEQVTVRYKKKHRQLLRAQFGWPGILGFLLIATSFYSIMTSFETVGWILFILILIGGSLFSFYNQRSLSGFLKRSGKQFMSSFTYFQKSVDSMPLIFFISIVIKKMDGSYLVIPLSMAIGLYVVLSIVSYKLNREIRGNLTEEFPEVFKVAN